MTIQLTIYIVKWLYNCVYSNDYTIDHIHSQMTIQLTKYNDHIQVKWLYKWLYTIVKWLYNWLYT